MGDFKQRGNVLLIVLTFSLVVAVGIALYVINNSSKTSPSDKSQITIEPDQASKSYTSTTEYIYKNAEVEAIRKDAAKKLNQKGQSPAEPEYKFDYTLGSEIKSKSRLNWLQIPEVYAASGCDISKFPSKFWVYTLANHLGPSDAAEIAKLYGISSPASSQPASSGFSYFFSDSATKGFLSIYEASGIYNYHRVTASASASLFPQNQNEVISKSTAALSKYQLPVSSLELNGVYPDSQSKEYSVSYTRNWGTLPTVDSQLLTKLTSNFCAPPQPSEMNKVLLEFKDNLELLKVVNSARNETKKIEVTRLGLDDAIAEYKDKLPVPPIVKGGGSATSGSVTISEVMLAYYDMGAIFPQVMYLPMYVTRGKVTISGSSVEVTTLFPAVSQKELESKGLGINFTKENQGRVLKLGTFNPIPPTPEPLSGGACYGNLVDHNIVCDVGGTTICNLFAGVPVDKDPTAKDVCDKGCKSFDDTVEVTLDESACQKFLLKLGIPPGSWGSGREPGNEPSNYTGPVHCVDNACPC